MSAFHQPLLPPEDNFDLSLQPTDCPMFIRFAVRARVMPVGMVIPAVERP